MPELIDKTTYGFRMPSGDMVEVGDRRFPTFKNHLKINRWGGECYLLPSIEQTGHTKVTPHDDRIESESNLTIVRHYPMPPSKQWELGSFRMEITHLKKPPTNKIVSNILSHNVVAHYQPSLTQQEIDDGCVRPDNIEGSYAFMHATRQPIHASKAIADKYQACKFGHKPRPRIVDDNGDWVWAELSIDLATGLQVITIPLEFYEYAKYPIRHDTGADTFGYTSEGGTVVALISNSYGGPVATGAVGTATSITVKIHTVTSGPHDSACALYKESDDTLVGYTEEKTIDTDQDVTYDFGTPPTISAIDYVIVIWSGGSMNAWGDSLSTGSRRDNTNYNYPNWENPASNFYNLNFWYPLYCTYTPGAPPAGQPTMKRWGGVPHMEPKGKGVW